MNEPDSPALTELLRLNALAIAAQAAGDVDEDRRLSAECFEQVFRCTPADLRAFWSQVIVTPKR